MTALVQNIFRNPTCNIVILACSFKVLFIFLATPFCWDVHGMVFYIFIPLSSQYFLKSSFTCSPTLFDCKHFTFKFAVFLTIDFHLMKAPNIEFILQKIDHIFSNCNKYHIIIGTSKGSSSWRSHIPIWINSNFVVLDSFPILEK